MMGHSSTFASFVLVLLSSEIVTADYSCVCNYAVEYSVLSQPQASSTTLGYMYEFDCKAVYDMSGVPDGWLTVAYEHQIGYLKEDSKDLQITVCQGEAPKYDEITVKPTPVVSHTMPPQTTTTSTSATTTTTTTTTTTSTPATTTTTQRLTTATTTRLPLTSPTTTTTTPTTTHERLTLRTTQQHIIMNNVRLCPPILHQYTREDGGALTQYDRSCYELVPIRAIWAKAENDCRAKGGHLFHIQSADFQSFIYHWIQSYQFDHAVWTGLHDLVNEESFEWMTGDHVIYTNWYPDRYGNLASHHIENCVLLVPYSPYYGQWDDVQCGITSIFGDSGQQNPFICEYRIDGSHFPPSNILVG